MTDNELNTLVAEKVMGYSNLRYIYTSNSPTSKSEILAGEINGDIKRVPDYCNDIAGAWGVVEKLTNDGYFVTIHVNDGVWVEQMTQTKVGDDLHVSWQEIAVIKGDSTPRAICLAALKAIK